jgi:hypothetical protein
MHRLLSQPFLARLAVSWRSVSRRGLSCLALLVLPRPASSRLGAPCRAWSCRLPYLVSPCLAAVSYLVLPWLGLPCLICSHLGVM